MTLTPRVPPVRELMVAHDLEAPTAADVQQLREQLNDAYRQRDLAVVLAARLASFAGLRAGRYIDPEAEAPFDWVVHIDFPKGQVTWHVDARVETPLFQVLPVIVRNWDGHDKAAGEANLRHFVQTAEVDVKAPHSFEVRSWKLQDIERSVCVLALGNAGGNISEAAAFLGITRHALKRRMIKYRIAWVVPGSKIGDDE